jgi:hypothetical protein
MDAPIPRDAQRVGRVLTLPIWADFTIGTLGFEYPTGTGGSSRQRCARDIEAVTNQEDGGASDF